MGRRTSRRGVIISVLVANAATLEKRKEVVERFMKAYRESIDYMYSANPQVIKDYAEFVKTFEQFVAVLSSAPDNVRGFIALSSNPDEIMMTALMVKPVM